MLIKKIKQNKGVNKEIGGERWTISKRLSEIRE